MPIQLSPAACRALKARAHALEPVVLIGNAGLTPAVLREVDRNLEAHELIKVRAANDDHDARMQLLRQVCEDLGAAPVQHIGKILVIYRQKSVQTPKPKSKPKRKPARVPKRNFQNRA